MKKNYLLFKTPENEEDFLVSNEVDSCKLFGNGFEEFKLEDDSLKRIFKLKGWGNFKRGYLVEIVSPHKDNADFEEFICALFTTNLKTAYDFLGRGKKQ